MLFLNQDERSFLDKVILYSTDGMDKTMTLTPFDQVILSRLIQWDIVKKDGDKIRIKPV